MLRQRRKSRPSPRVRLEVLELECRVLLTTGTAIPGVILLNPAGGGAVPQAFGGTYPLSPAQIRHAYGFDQITFQNGTVAGDGSGQTIAIVDAYDDPNIASDLAAFDAAFGLAGPPTFTKVNQTGGSTMPAGDTGWGMEIALDVEWAHAIAPKANILLVEANSSSLNDLLTAVNYARNAAGVVAVSMSWGAGEFSGEANYDSYFTTPSGHAGVTFLGSSGDNGAPSGWPAFSTHVVAVGGTTLTVDGSGNWLGESGWSGSGGSVSSFLSQPSYQNGIVTQSTTNRANPDVAYDADPNTGFAVYDTYGQSGWLQVGGTSAGAPQWAALIAIADQGRALAGLGSLDGFSQTLPKLYQLSASDFHDETSGNNGNAAGAGYDLVTGRGSPFANRVVADLVGSTSSPGTTAPSNLTATAGNAQVTLNWTGVSGATYNLYRSTSAGTETLYKTGLTSTAFTDTGLTNGTTYFYKVSAVVGGIESAKSNEASAVPAAPTTTALLSIDAAGGAVGSYRSDTGFSGGSPNSTTHSIDTSRVTNPAPQGVYQTWRAGNFTYTLSGLTSGATYTVRLDFSENIATAAGQRVFNVAINGTTVLSNFDVFAATGGAFRAITESFFGPASSTGKITITFTTVVGAARVNGIVLYAGQVNAARAATGGGFGSGDSGPFLNGLATAVNALLSPTSGRVTSGAAHVADPNPFRGGHPADQAIATAKALTTDHGSSDAEPESPAEVGWDLPDELP